MLAGTVKDVILVGGGVDGTTLALRMGLALALVFPLDEPCTGLDGQLFESPLVPEEKTQVLVRVASRVLCV